MSTQDLDLTRRHEELYGESRNALARRLQSVLTADHVRDHVKHLNRHDSLDNESDLRWKSITKWNFQGEQLAKDDGIGKMSPKARKSAMLNNMHFDFGFDTTNINDNIYKSSMTQADFGFKNVPKPFVHKPDATVNIPDFAPQYLSDNLFATSLYSKTFQDKEAMQRPLLQARTMLRQSNVDDLRTTHFKFGSDPENFMSETNVSYYLGKRQSRIPTASLDMDLVRRMQMEENNSAVFRNGDYNMRRSFPFITTNHRDFNNRLYSFNTAAIENESMKSALPSIKSSCGSGKRVQFADGKPQNKYTSEVLLLDLRKACLLRDTNGNGRLEKDEISSACNTLPLPLPQYKVQDILNELEQDSNSTVKYDDFIKKYGKENSVRLPHISNSITNLAPKTEALDPKSLRHESDVLGTKYHTAAHFEFGTDREQPASIYGIDYFGVYSQPIIHSAPISSKVMHEVNGDEPVITVNKSQFMHPEGLSSLRTSLKDEVKKNHEKLNTTHVVLTCDKYKYSQDRLNSLSHNDFTGPPEGFRAMTPLHVKPARYNYLDSDGTPKAEISEARDVYTNHNNDNICQRINENKERCQARVDDGKETHFLFGSDEIDAKTSGNDAKSNKMQPAGVKNMQDGNHQHLSVSKNTCDNDDTFDSGLKHLQGQLRNVLNKRNICPLSLNLRRAFLECDAHQTGKVSRDDIKTICTRLQLNLYDGLLDKMMDRCNSDQKGNIDYSEFARHLTLPGQPISLPTPVGTASIMGYDYRPIYQRNFTDAQLLTMDEMKKKEPRPMTSHLFHTDNTADYYRTSTSNADFISPALMTERRSLPAR